MDETWTVMEYIDNNTGNFSDILTAGLVMFPVLSQKCGCLMLCGCSECLLCCSFLMLKQCWDPWWKPCRRNPTLSLAWVVSVVSLETLNSRQTKIQQGFPCLCVKYGVLSTFFLKENTKNHFEGLVLGVTCFSFLFTFYWWNTVWLSLNM